MNRNRLFGVLLVVLLAVSVGNAAIIQNTGASLSAYAATIGPAHSGTQVIFASADDSATGWWQIASQNVNALGSVNAISGEGGAAVATIDGLTALGQSVGANSIGQATLLNLNIGTLATENATAAASVGESTFQAGANENAFSIKGTIVAAVSVSSAGPVGPCSPGGSAVGGVNVTLLDAASVVGTGCSPNPCD